jgi:hypothetical protein
MNAPSDDLTADSLLNGNAACSDASTASLASNLLESWDICCLEYVAKRFHVAVSIGTVN